MNGCFARLKAAKREMKSGPLPVKVPACRMQPAGAGLGPADVAESAVYISFMNEKYFMLIIFFVWGYLAGKSTAFR